MKKKLEIKQKMINHIIISGKKQTSEKIAIKVFKTLQKQSNKQVKKLFQLAIVNTSPVFKLHTISNKKKKKNKPREIPAFVSNKTRRISAAIKVIIKTSIKKGITAFYNAFKQEILITCKHKSNSIEQKNNLQTQAILQKRYFLYYRWN